MELFAIIVFGVSLVVIATLFVLKYFEVRSGSVVGTSLRYKADRGALALKYRISIVRLDLARVSPVVLLYSRYLVHEGALRFASIARMAERQAHRLADLVSHKRSFVPRETRSEFLRKVSNRKNGETGALE